ncbi:transposase [Corynebacterium diphtheriae]|nr:transposase [Corynebacterium diphtheriae]
MHPRSKLSQAQREQAVELFEQGYGATAVANRLGVKQRQIQRLEGRFRLHGRLCLVSKPTKKTVLLRHQDGDPSPP